MLSSLSLSLCELIQHANKKAKSMITCTRRLEFDAAHRVLGHGGRCRFLHGHRYSVEVTCVASELDNLDMIIDFSCIKGIIGKWIDSNFDHNILLNPEDPQLRHIINTEEQHPYVMTCGNPTAENIARELYDKTHTLLPSAIKITKIRVHETPNCYAEYLA